MEIDLDGITDLKKPYIQYLGKASRQPNGSWICLADVNGSLCRVQVTVSEVPFPLVWEGDQN